MPEPERPVRSRAESREVVELQAIRARHPEFADVVDMHIELAELQRRIQGRVPLPWLELSTEIIQRHDADGRPLLPFESIPLELTDLRLMVRQTSDVLHRHGALDTADYQEAQALGRDMELLTIVGTWYRRVLDRHTVAAGMSSAALDVQPGMPDTIAEVLGLAMRPFLSRCAEVLQQRPDLSCWTHSHCALCGAMPDLAVITPAAERHLICSRCALRWKFEALTCPFCHNSDRSLITSFAAHLGDSDYRVYACDVCHRFLKAYDARRATRPVMPMVDAVATLPLDAAAIQRGYTSS